MKKTILAAALAGLATGAHAGILTYVETFGTFGDPTDLPTNINETLTASGWAADLPAGATNIVFTVEVRGTLSSQGSVTNTGATSTTAAAVVQLLSDWTAVTTNLASADVTFGSAPEQIINVDLGTINGGETVDFGPETVDEGWITTYTGTYSGTDITYAFSNQVVSYAVGSGNFDTSIVTGSAGGLRVTVTYDDPPSQVPTPAPIALMGLGLLGFGIRRRMKRA